MLLYTCFFFKIPKFSYEKDKVGISTVRISFLSPPFRTLCGSLAQRAARSEIFGWGRLGVIWCFLLFPDVMLFCHHFQAQKQSMGDLGPKMNSPKCGRFQICVCWCFAISLHTLKRPRVFFCAMVLGHWFLRVPFAILRGSFEQVMGEINCQPRTILNKSTVPSNSWRTAPTIPSL